MGFVAVRRPVWGVLVVALSLFLAACIFAPGKFTSEFVLNKDRSFTFRYSGDLYLVPLAKPNEPPKFEPSPCYSDDGYEERPCSKEEVAKQETEWSRQQQEKARSDAQAAQFLFGGIDPSDPKAATEIADRMRRQAGWKKVEYLGDGRFDVDFEIAGMLDHDFAFPTIERFPMANAFVQVSLRSDGTVRIDAPGFGPSGGASGAGAIMQGMMQGGLKNGPDNETGANKEGQNAAATESPLVDGTFTIRTDGQILANNTDEGPKPSGKSRELHWTVTPRIPAAPTALIKVSP